MYELRTYTWWCWDCRYYFIYFYCTHKHTHTHGQEFSIKMLFYSYANRKRDPPRRSGIQSSRLSSYISAASLQFNRYHRNNFIYLSLLPYYFLFSPQITQSGNGSERESEVNCTTRPIDNECRTGCPANWVRRVLIDWLTDWRTDWLSEWRTERSPNCIRIVYRCEFARDAKQQVHPKVSKGSTNYFLELLLSLRLENWVIIFHFLNISLFSNVPIVALRQYKPNILS